MRLIGFTIVAALAFASCSKPVSNETESPDATASAQKPASAPPPQSAQTTAPATPPPATTTNPATAKAPDGVFYLVSAARVETASGVQNLPVGTGVRLLRPGLYQTPIGEVALSTDKLTNDLATARAARDAALATEAALRPKTPGPQNGATGAPSTPKPAPTPDANHLAAVKAMKIAQADREIATLQKQYDALKVQEDALSLKKSKEDYNRGMKGRNVATTTGQQLSQVQSQMNAIQTRLSAALVERYKIR